MAYLSCLKTCSLQTGSCDVSLGRDLRQSTNNPATTKKTAEFHTKLG